jgi:DNA processing protein
MTDLKEKTPLEYWLALSSVKGLGNVRIKQLIAHFGSVKAILEAKSTEIEQLASLTPAIATRIGKVADNLPMFREKLDALHEQNIRVLSLEDPNYPAQLKTIPDAPAILCQVGDLTEVDTSCVAIVGTREPTPNAKQLTLELSTNLTSAGFTVVSGLALGIDTFAHTGALTCSGETIAVLGTDVSTVYPSKNWELATDIQAQGCLLSEHPFQTSPTPRNLVQRNRIISGLSLATIVIEARKQSGTLHTARFAQGQGRPIYACQWEEDRGREGTRTLIKDGAVPFAPDEIDKVVEALQPPEQHEETDTGQLLLNI